MGPRRLRGGNAGAMAARSDRAARRASPGVQPARRAEVGEQERWDQRRRAVQAAARGTLPAVYHGVPSGLNLKQLVRSYNDLVEDATRVCSGSRHFAAGVASRGKRSWSFDLPCSAGSEADIVFVPRRCSNTWTSCSSCEGQRSWRAAQSEETTRLEDPAIDSASRPDPAGGDPGDHAHATQVPYEAEPLAIRGLAVVTYSSSDKEIGEGQVRKRPPMTGGLSRKHNPIHKEMFKGAADGSDGQTRSAARLL